MHFPYGYLGHPHSYPRVCGVITDIGFSNSWRHPLTGEPKRTYTFSANAFCFDRFVRVELGECGHSLARVAVKETHVRDERLRGDLDFTGFEVCVGLREEAFRLVQDHLAAVETDGEREFPRLAIRIPTRPFTFPPTRGCANPWETGKNVVGKLRRIKGLNSDRMTITTMRAPLTPVPGNGSLQDRYGGWLSSSLAVRYGLLTRNGQ